MMYLKGNVIGFMIFILCFLNSAVSSAWQGNNHYHGGGYYGPGPGVYYGPGGYWGGWGGPNVIINIPVVPVQPYVRECDTVEVCDTYTDECWLERRCI
jgi:hypothetical protein